MIEFELQELQRLRWGQISTQYEPALTLITIYLTMIFAYLAAAHFIGKDLNRFQATVLSSVFAIAALYTMYQLNGLFVGVSFGGEELTKGYLFLSDHLNESELRELGEKVRKDSLLGWEEGLLAIIGMLGILVSLMFMSSVRHLKTE